jgi:hypothetical protein
MLLGDQEHVEIRPEGAAHISEQEVDGGATNAEPKPFRWTKSADDILVAINRFCKRTIDEHHSALLKTSESGH